MFALPGFVVFITDRTDICSGETIHRHEVR